MDPADYQALHNQLTALAKCLAEGADMFDRWRVSAVLAFASGNPRGLAAVLAFASGNPGGFTTALPVGARAGSRLSSPSPVGTRADSPLLSPVGAQAVSRLSSPSPVGARAGSLLPSPLLVAALKGRPGRRRSVPSARLAPVSGTTLVMCRSRTFRSYELILYMTRE